MLTRTKKVTGRVRRGLEIFSHCEERVLPLSNPLTSRPERTTSPSSEAGLSLLEVVVTLFIVGVLSGSAISNLAAMKNPLHDGASQTIGFAKQVRAKALATTSAYTLLALDSRTLIAESSKSCASTTRTRDLSLTLVLPERVSLPSTELEVCFDSRGLAQGEQSFDLEGSDGRLETIEIFLGGAVRIKP